MEHDSDNNKKCLSVGNFRIQSVVCSFKNSGNLGLLELPKTSKCKHLDMFEKKRPKFKFSTNFYNFPA